MRNKIVALRETRKTRGQNAGLLLHRYLAEDATAEGNPAEKSNLLEAAIAAVSDAGVLELYTAAFERNKSAFPALTVGIELGTVENQRLVVGLGTENVLETGIRLNHVYGMPIIPGSALKGLAAHYCHQVWGNNDSKFKQPTSEQNFAYRRYLLSQGSKPEDNFHRLLFGSTEDSGCILFHDAWLTPQSINCLTMDVMTPHHPKWLDGSVAPSDFDSPVPVPFLAVSGKFFVAVSWIGPASPESQSWLTLVSSLLKEALKEWGVGAKTSSGYGRLGLNSFVSTAPVSVVLPKPGMRVQAVLLDEKTKKGGWRARHKDTGLCGPIQNSEKLPDSCKPGDVCDLIVALVNQREIAFKYS